MRAAETNLELACSAVLVLVLGGGWSGCAKRLNEGPSPVEDIDGNKPIVVATPNATVVDDGVAATVARSTNDVPTIATRCNGRLRGCLPDGAEEPLGDVFAYRYRSGAVRIVTAKPDEDGSAAECRFDGECESWGCGEHDSCGNPADVERCPVQTFAERRPKKRQEFCGCVNGHCRSFEQKRPELVLEFEDIQGSVVQRGWAIPNAYDRRLLFNSLAAAVEHSAATRTSRFDPLETAIDEMPTVRQCFKALRMGARETLYLDVTVNDRSEASAASVRGGSASLRKCVRERLLTSSADWRPIPGLTGIRATMHASVVTVPAAAD